MPDLAVYAENLGWTFAIDGERCRETSDAMRHLLDVGFSEKEAREYVRLLIRDAEKRRDAK